MRDIFSEEVTNLIEGLKFRDKIDYLLKNPELESKKLTNLDSLFCEREFYPNCFGTVLFLFGAERDFLKDLKYERGKNNEFIVLSNEGSFAVFPSKFNGPGSLQPEHMKLFLRRKCRELQKPNIGSVVSTGGFVLDGEGYPEGYSDIIHSALYLGELDGKSYIFEKDGIIGGLRFDSLDNMVSRSGINKKFFHSYELTV
ncbi:MAG: hypothetical protein AABW75_05135 [Nanoarchaeota archaeon]